jgi:hypothetical protein
MLKLELSDEETAILTRELQDIENDPYPFSPRIHTQWANWRREIWCTSYSRQPVISGPRSPILKPGFSMERALLAC